MTNRQIKFRAWDEDKKEMLAPQDLSQGRVYWPWLGLKDVELMQFTGLLDKNGKEIYEGDIASCDQLQGYQFPVVGVVHFGVEKRKWPNLDGSDGFMYAARVYIDTRPFQERNGSEFCVLHANPEIIGNIYENPELLPPKEE